MMEQEPTPEETHENIIEQIENAILRQVNASTIVNHKYMVEKEVFFEMDLLALFDNKLYIFEIKTGTKEKKARK